MKITTKVCGFASHERFEVKVKMCPALRYSVRSTLPLLALGSLLLHPCGLSEPDQCMTGGYGIMLAYGDKGENGGGMRLA